MPYPFPYPALFTDVYTLPLSYGATGYGSDLVAQPARVTGTVVEPFNLQLSARTLPFRPTPPGITVTATFTATPASVVSANAEPYVGLIGTTLILRVGPATEPTQTVTFVGPAATAEDVALEINTQTLGVNTTAAGGTNVQIDTDAEGTAARLEIVGGTSLAILGFVAGVSTGGGNVANIAAVTVAEIAARVAVASANVTTTSAGGRVSIATVATGSAATLEIDPAGVSDVDAILGLSNVLAEGVDAQGLVAVRWGRCRGVMPVQITEPRGTGPT